MPDHEQTRRFRLRFTLKQLFLAVALVAVGLAVGKWVSRKEVLVRAPRAEDEELFVDYIENVENADLHHKRNVAVVTGRFMKGTWLLCSLYGVQAGVVERANERWVGRDEECTDGPIWELMTCGMSLPNDFIRSQCPSGAVRRPAA